MLLFVIKNVPFFIYKIFLFKLKYIHTYCMLNNSNQQFFLLMQGHVLSHLKYVTYMLQNVFNHSSYVSTWYHGCNTCLFLNITYHMFFAQIYDQTRTHTDHTQTTTHNLQHTQKYKHRRTHNLQRNQTTHAHQNRDCK